VGNPFFLGSGLFLVLLQVMSCLLPGKCNSQASIQLRVMISLSPSAAQLLPTGLHQPTATFTAFPTVLSSGQTEPAPTSASCRMDDVWTGNTFSLCSSGFIDNHAHLSYLLIVIKCLTYLPTYIHMIITNITSYILR
jgi:hypothetical protein